MKRAGNLYNRIVVSENIRVEHLQAIIAWTLIAKAKNFRYNLFKRYSPRACPACRAAAAGTMMRLTVVRPIGTSMVRLFGAAFLASALSGALSPAKEFAEPDYTFHILCGEQSLSCPC